MVRIQKRKITDLRLLYARKDEVVKEISTLANAARIREVDLPGGLGPARVYECDMDNGDTIRIPVQAAVATFTDDND